MTLADVQVREIMLEALDLARENLITQDMSFERIPRGDAAIALTRHEATHALTDQQLYLLTAVVVSETAEGIEAISALLSSSARG